MVRKSKVSLYENHGLDERDLQTAYLREALPRDRAQAEGNAMGEVVLEPVTPEAVRRANKRGAATTNAPTAIVQADVENVDGALHLRLVFRDGTRLSVPTSRIEELADANADALTTLEVSPSYDSISFPAIDADIYVPGLLSDLYGSRVLAEKGRAGGKRSSPAKTAAVRENGRKGGRPRKKTKPEAA